MPIPLAVIAGGAALGSALLGKRSADKATKANQDALDFEKQKWEMGAPFRERGTAMLNQEVDPEALSAIFADPGNPYAANNAYRSPMRAMGGAMQTAGRSAVPRGAIESTGSGLGPAPMDIAPEMGAQRARMATFAQMMARPRRGR
jgi:hypothetical protein